MSDEELSDWIKEKNEREAERYAAEADISQAKERRQKMRRKIGRLLALITMLFISLVAVAIIFSPELDQVRWPPTKTPTPTPVFTPAVVTDFQWYFLLETLDFNKLPRPQDGELSIEAEGSMFWSRDKRIRIVFWKPHHSIDINGKKSIFICYQGSTSVIHVDMLYEDKWIYYDCDSGRIAISSVPYALDGTP